MVYPALLPLMRTPRLPVVDWTDSPADLNGLVRFAERRNLVSARVPSHFKRSLPTCDVEWDYHLWFWWLVFIINIFSLSPFETADGSFSSALGGVCSTRAVLWVHCCMECPWQLHFDGTVQSSIFLRRFQAKFVRKRSVFLGVLEYLTLFSNYVHILQRLVLALLLILLLLLLLLLFCIIIFFSFICAPICIVCCQGLKGLSLFGFIFPWSCLE